MFPPARCEKVTTWLTGLFESLARAGLPLGPNVKLDELENCYEVRAALLSPIPGSGWKFLRNYILEYSQECGWKVKELKRTNYFLSFKASAT